MDEAAVLPGPTAAQHSLEVEDLQEAEHGPLRRALVLPTDNGIRSQVAACAILPPLSRVERAASVARVSGVEDTEQDSAVEVSDSAGMAAEDGVLAVAAGDAGSAGGAVSDGDGAGESDLAGVG